MLVDQILTDKAFQFSPALLRKLITESWQDSRYFYFGGTDYPIYRVILNIQEIVLDQCLDSGVLQRIQNQELQSDPGSDPLKIAEIFRSLTDGIFTELSAPAAGTSPFAISTIRRNLQREYIKRLSEMVLGPKNEPFYGHELPLHRLLRRHGDGSARRQEPGATSSRGDRPEDRQAHRPEGHQDRRHVAGPPQGDPPPDRQGPEGEPERQRAVIADVPSDRRARFLASRWSRLARSSIMDMALLERPFAGAHGDGHALNPMTLKPSCHRADRLRGQGSPSPSLPEHWTAADSPDLTATARLRMACGRASIRLGSIPA